MTKTLPSFSGRAETPPPDVVAQIWRRRRLFGLVFLLSLLPVLAVAFFWPPVYYASGNVEIGNQEPTSSSASAAWIEKLGDPADLESQLLIILSRRMVRLALARPGIFEAVEQECRYLTSSQFSAILARNCDKLKPDSDELLEHVQKRYSVTALGRSRVLAIGYELPLPDVAFVLANALLITYLEDQRAENAHSREASSAWLLNEVKRQSPAAGGLEGQTASDTRKTFYQDLYSRAKDLESERRVLLSSGRLVSLAEIPRLPSFPKRLPLVTAGLTMACLLAALAALRKDMTDRTVRGTYDLEAQAKAPVLAIFPGQHLRRASFTRWLADPQKLAGGQACARALYLQLLLFGKNRKRQCILVASETNSEARAHTTMALACAAAESGRRVLLVDCNFTCLSSKEPDPVAGFADILKGDAEPDQAVIRGPIEGIDIIEAGRFEGDPAVLLLDGDLAKFMDWTAKYDLVTFDVSASSALSNVMVLADHTDGVVWCARWGHSLKCGVKAAVEELRRLGVNVLGLAVTMADFREMRHYERPRTSRLAYPEFD